MFNKIKELDKKYALSIFFGILFGGVSTYGVFFIDTKPDLKFELLSANKVFDVYTDIGKLDILYDNESLKETNKNLQIMLVKLVNAGGGEISENNYVSKYPLGLIIKNGQIIEKPEITDYSSDYYKLELNSFVISNDTLFFPKLLFNGSDYFTLKLLVLHDKEEEISFTSTGRISQIDSIDIVDISTPEKRKSTFEIIYDTLEKYLKYFVIALFIAGFVAIIIAVIFSRYRRSKRSKLIKNIKIQTEQITELDEKIFDLYIKYDLDKLESILVLLSDLTNNKPELNILFLSQKINKNFFSLINHVDIADSLKPKIHLFYKYEELINYGFLNINEEKLEVVNSMKQALESILARLKSIV